MPLTVDQDQGESEGSVGDWRGRKLCGQRFAGRGEQRWDLARVKLAVAAATHFEAFKIYGARTTRAGPSTVRDLLLVRLSTSPPIERIDN